MIDAAVVAQQEAALRPAAPAPDARIAALEAENARLRELVARGGAAVSASYEEAQCEYQGHDKRGARANEIVRQWRADVRAALAGTAP